MDSGTFHRVDVRTGARPCRRSARRWLGAGVVGGLVAFGLVLPAGAAAQPDADGDGLYDWDEANVYGTDAGAYDSDGDGVGDGQEVYDGTDPLSGGWAGAPDGGNPAQCVSPIQFGDTGNPPSAPAPAPGVECDHTVQQSSAASS